MFAQQHAVAEDVAGHVADADDGEILALAVDAELAEMALDRFPGAARGDAHALVVVTHRTARSEGVAQPEAIVDGHAVGDVGERRRALVGRHHQVGIALVVAHDLGRMHDAARRLVVGQVQKTADEGLVTGDHLGHDIVAAAAFGQAFGDETALGPDRHDDRVLDHLGLHQAEHLGTEVLAPVRPAQAAAGHPSATQMHGFDTGRINPDLDMRPGQRQFVDPPAVELEGDVGLGRAVGAGLVIIGPQRALDQIEEAPQDAVFIEIDDLVEQLGDTLDDALGRRLAFFGEGRIETDIEQFDQQPGDAGVFGQRRFHVFATEGDAGLAQVLAVGPDDDDLAPVQPGPHHQAVEAVVLDLARPDAGEGFLELFAVGLDLEGVAARFFETEIVNPQFVVAVGPVNQMRLLVDRQQPHVFHDGQAIGQRDRLADVEDLEAHGVAGRTGRAVQVELQRSGVDQGIHLVDIRRRLRGGESRPVSSGKCLAVGFPIGFAALLSGMVDERVLEVVAPRPRRIAQSLFEAAGFGQQFVARLGADDELNAGQGRFTDMGVKGRDMAAEGFGDQIAEAHAQIRGMRLARHVNQAGDKPPEGIAS